MGSPLLYYTLVVIVAECISLFHIKARTWLLLQQWVVNQAYSLLGTVLA